MGCRWTDRWSGRRDPRGCWSATSASRQGCATSRRRATAPERLRGVRVAVFDLGSTSFQLLVGDVESDGGLTPVLRDRVVLNLGADVAATGRVQPEAVERAANVVRRFRNLASRVDAGAVIPVATAAFREAANRPELAFVIEEAIGTPLRILSGNLEVGATVAGI